jgi:hypothetical protein
MDGARSHPARDGWQATGVPCPGTDVGVGLPQLVARPRWPAAGDVSGFSGLRREKRFENHGAGKAEKWWIEGTTIGDSKHLRKSRFMG